ncbi:MAG: M3 family metallopeptidase [Rikenellaceae bacterium]|nr:M3 family metallopeptidase [Rikenellaceae bacterium]
MKKLLFIMSFSALVASCGNDMPVVELPEIDTTNPLLAEWDTPYATPPFDKIKITDYEPAIETAIAVSRAEVDAIINNPAKPSFANTIEALERQGELLGRILGVFFNLREADTSDEMDAIALRIQPKLTELSNDVSLNPQLFERVKAVYEGSQLFLSKDEKKLLEDTYKSFSRSGAALNDEDKALYRQYTAELSEATLLFAQNSLSATNAFSINITDEKQVAELPAFVKEGLAAEAKARGEQGWTVTLQAPSYVPFVTYSSQRDLKEKLYRAYNTRAYGGEFDNVELVKRIATLRMNIAKLLGYNTYADYVLEEAMAQSSSTVTSFLAELRDKTIEYGHKDYAMINEYAKTIGHQGDVMPWDWAYYSEKYKNEKYAINDEQVKPYLKLDNVIKGVFMVAEKLYGLQFVANNEIAVYHPDVTAYEVKDADGKFLSVLYLDFFPRASKRSGAWMTEFRGAKVVNGVETRPLVSLVMNFTKPTETTPSLLTFDELTTFLHEFGHALHGMLAQGKYESLNGTSVYRDFVELPSQIMENWATEKEYLDMWAVHYQTGEAIPAELVEKIVAAKNYLAAYSNLRQLSFGMSDMAWHTLSEPFEGDVEAFEREAMSSVQITPVVEGTALSTSFNHIFAGGYAAGYYGYKWAEVLAADAFSLFAEKGIFDAATASSFRHLLEQGGQRHPMDIYVEFRGHEPQVDALIKSMNLQ